MPSPGGPRESRTSTRARRSRAAPVALLQIPEEGDLRFESGFRMMFNLAPVDEKSRICLTSSASRDILRIFVLRPAATASSGLRVSRAAACQGGPPMDESPVDLAVAAAGKVKGAHPPRTRGEASAPPYCGSPECWARATPHNWPISGRRSFTSVIKRR